MLSVQRARALVAIVAFLCVYPIQYVQANTCDPDFDRNCICDNYTFETNCRFATRRRSVAGTIAGAIVAGLFLIGGIAALLIFKRRRDRRAASSQAMHAAAATAAFSQPTYQTTYQPPPATYNPGPYPPPQGMASPYAGQPNSGAQYYAPPPGPPPMGAPNAPGAAHFQGNQSPPLLPSPY
ncbi:hypothetical protein K435DRAFT_776122, partial [Dendrothele bispora CBS 962.96]